MPVKFHRFDHYYINYLTPTQELRLDQIVIYCSQQYSDGQTLPVGTLRFWKGQVPKNQYFSDNNVMLNFHLDDFPRILDLLRSEKPCFICLDPETQFGYLATRYQPQGHNILAKK